VKKVYTAKRTTRIKGIFENARTSLSRFIESQPEATISSAEKQELLARLAAVKLELPPPAAVYSDEPDLFTRNDVYFEETSDGKVRIRVGGALFFTIRSHFNLAFTMAHELAHSIDPCELRARGISVRAYDTLAQCFGTPPEAMEHECSSRGKLPEIFADWAATEVAADMLLESSTKFTAPQLRSAVFSTMRDLCREEDDDPTEIEAGLAASHPTVAYRMNRIFGDNPRIRTFLGCRDSHKLVTAITPPYCTWTGPANAGPANGVAGGAAPHGVSAVPVKHDVTELKGKKALGRDY
jgi:hypothetical protein